MQMKPLLNAVLKYRIGKKWKKRYCVVEKNPEDEDLLLFYALKEEDFNLDSRPANSSDTIFGYESGRHIDKEGYVIVLVGLNRVHCLAHTKDTEMFDWADTLAASLIDSHYHVTLKKSSDSNRLQKGLQGSLHAQRGRLCLIGEPEFGNKFICSWPLSSLNYWIEDCYFWIEADKTAGKISGKHQFEMNRCQLNNLVIALDHLDRSEQTSPCCTMRTSVSIDDTTSTMAGSFINAVAGGSQYDCEEMSPICKDDAVSRSSEVQIPRSRKNSSPDRKRTSLVNNSDVKTENLIANATKEILGQNGDPDCMFYPDEDLSHQEDDIKSKNHEVPPNSSMNFRHKEPHIYVNLQFDNLSTPASSSAESASPSAFFPVHSTSGNPITPKHSAIDSKSQSKPALALSSTQPSPTSSCSSSNSFKNRFLQHIGRPRRRCSSNETGNGVKCNHNPPPDDKNLNPNKIEFQRCPSHCEDALDYIKTPEDEVFTNPSSLEQDLCLATIKEGQLASNSQECEEVEDNSSNSLFRHGTINDPILRTSRSRKDFIGHHSVHYPCPPAPSNNSNSICSSPPDNNSQSSSSGLNRRNSLATSAPSSSNFCSRRSLKLSSKCAGSHSHNEYCNDNCVYSNNSLPRDLFNRRTIPSAYVNLVSNVPMEVSNPRYNYAWLDLRPSAEGSRILPLTTSPPLSELPDCRVSHDFSASPQSSNLNYVNVIAGSSCSEAVHQENSSSNYRINGSVTSSNVDYAQIDFTLTAALLDIGDSCDTNSTADCVSLSSTSPNNSTDKFRKYVTKLKSFGSRRKSDSMSSSN